MLLVAMQDLSCLPRAPAGSKISHAKQYAAARESRRMKCRRTAISGAVLASFYRRVRRKPERPMPAPLARVETTPHIPDSADAVVIGGGIVGVFAGYYLAQRGLKVALVEKGLIG